MNKLIGKRLAIVGILMVAVFSLVGCANDESDSFNWIIDIGWVGLVVALVSLVIIGLIVYLLIKRR